MLGTNPLSFSFPAAEESPVVLDMATSVVAFGKVEEALRKGGPGARLPPGWGVDGGGTPTCSAAAVKAGGALLPLGGDRVGGGHKGYGLGAIVDLFCGALPGAGWGPRAANFASAVAGTSSREQGCTPSTPPRATTASTWSRRASQR